MKYINWNLRFQNKDFWISFIPALFIFISAVLNVFDIKIDFIELEDKLVAVVYAAFGLLAMLGIVEDHTTKGVGDSERALSRRNLGED